MGGDAGGVHHQPRTPPVADLAGGLFTWVEGDFVGFAIAVRILGLEGLHDLAQVVPGLRHFEAELVEPGLIDHEMLAGGKEALGTAGRQYGDLAVDGHEFLGGRLFLEERLDIWQLVEVVAQLFEGGGVAGGIVRVEGADIQIGDFA